LDNGLRKLGSLLGFHLKLGLFFTISQTAESDDGVSRSSYLHTHTFTHITSYGLGEAASQTVDLKRVLYRV